MPPAGRPSFCRLPGVRRQADIPAYLICLSSDTPPPVNRHLIASLSLALVLCASARGDEWTDVQGTSFKGDPAEVMGPFALFRTGLHEARRVRWQNLTPADCVRFYQKVRLKPARAADWSKAGGELTHELLGRVERVNGEELVKTDLKGEPEPEIVVVFFADNSVSQSWDLLGHSIGPFQNLQQKFPGQVEGLFFGMRHDITAHVAMATQMKVPWLVTDFRQQFKLETTGAFAPGPGVFNLVALNRDGVMLFVYSSPTEAEMDKFWLEVTQMLDLMRPANPRSWKDRLYYLRAVQPVIHAGDRADPVLVGDPLLPEGLSKNKAYLVDATLQVGPDGKVGAVKLKEDSIMPAAMAPMVTEALQKMSLFVPAVDKGVFVDGTYAYRIEVPH